MRDSWRLEDIFTPEEWSVITAGLSELMNADRWDEFEYSLTAELYGYFKQGDI